jgi:hypothetical protein
LGSLFSVILQRVEVLLVLLAGNQSPPDVVLYEAHIEESARLNHILSPVPLEGSGLWWKLVIDDSHPLTMQRLPSVFGEHFALIDSHPSGCDFSQSGNDLFVLRVVLDQRLHPFEQLLGALGRDEYEGEAVRDLL